MCHLYFQMVCQKQCQNSARVAIARRKDLLYTLYHDSNNFEETHLHVIKHSQSSMPI